MTEAKLSAGLTGGAMAGLLWLAALFALAIALGFTLLVVLFKLKVFSNVDILFYRGLVLIAIAGLATMVALAFVAPHFHARLTDAFTAAVLSMSLNLAFLVIMPVTIDRSITVFMLGFMDQHATQSFEADELRDAFSRIYLGDYHQIDRRLHEQLVSGNVERVGRGYRISSRGSTFIAFSRKIAWLFDTDPRFIEPAPISPPGRPSQ
jgi:hypothetical protein